ncbi:hypothetical protein BDZ97DRAFT_502446 [Flammula alnicola]|nr:hypothetical protein BDZ97DRAFT_502446 [Flammula alnicola]
MKLLLTASCSNTGRWAHGDARCLPGVRYNCERTLDTRRSMLTQLCDTWQYRTNLVPLLISKFVRVPYFSVIFLFISANVIRAQNQYLTEDYQLLQCPRRAIHCSRFTTPSGGRLYDPRGGGKAGYGRTITAFRNQNEATLFFVVVFLYRCCTRGFSRTMHQFAYHPVGRVFKNMVLPCCECRSTYF